MTTPIRKTKEEIRQKWVDRNQIDEPGITWEQMFDGAMQEYADQETAIKDERIRELEKALIAIRKECPVGSWFEKTCSKALKTKP